MTLTGKGCAFIKDWNLFRQWLEILDDFAITRLDLALDFYMGEMTHDKVIEGYNLEKFKALQSSKIPLSVFNRVWTEWVEIEVALLKSVVVILQNLFVVMRKDWKDLPSYILQQPN